RRLGRARCAGERERWAVWITGRPGSGKTTIASRVVEALKRRGQPALLLDLAEARRVILGTHHAAPEHDDVAHRAFVYAAARLVEAGVPVVLDGTAPRRAWRELARTLIARFAEVQLLCPDEVCAERERATRWGLVACASAAPAAGRGRGPDIVVDYECSLRPDLIIHTHLEDPWTAADAVLTLARQLQPPPAADRRP
ncbi:MAG TPA: adenylyl-sulfate kinase, partial [Methylomirabilota bacterium]|nr:adenylyl-sulfate kinase [Methylomirabilota bacterium]